MSTSKSSGPLRRKVIEGYTYAQLSALASAGGLTPNSWYVAADSKRRYWAESASKLQSDPASGGGYSASLMPFLPTDSLSLWTEQTQTGSGATFNIDSSVTLGGSPTIRIDFPANYNGGAGGTFNLGVSAATVDIPFAWDRDDLAVALMVSEVPVSANGITVYVGDATYANHWYVAMSPTAFTSTHNPQANEWLFYKPRNGSNSGDDYTVGGGTPATWLSGAIAGATAPKMRIRVRSGVAAGNPAMSIWIGFAGKLPKRRPTLIMCFDDGYASWYDTLRPLAKHYGLPVSLGLASAFVDTGGVFMTTAQVQAMHDDASGLFDFVNHSTNNDGYSTLGAAAYYANMVACHDWMRSIGISGDGPLHHPYVQNQWGNDLVALMQAGGFLTGRGGLAGSSYATEYKDQAIPFGDKQAYRLPTFSNLNSTYNLAAQKTSIDNLILRGGFGMLTGHDFGTSAAGAQYWNSSDLAQLLGYVRSKVDAGTLDVTTWSGWYRDLLGG